MCALLSIRVSGGVRLKSHACGPAPEQNRHVVAFGFVALSRAVRSVGLRAKSNMSMSSARYSRELARVTSGTPC